jgi:hypothetical protein
MTPSQEMTVLYWQAGAACLMGFDYFVKDAWREKANAAVRLYFAGVQARVDHDLQLSWEYFKSKIPRLTSGAIFLGVWWFLMNVVLPIPQSPTATALLALLAIGFFAGGFLGVFQVFMELYIPVGMGLAFRTVTTFLVSSPKGPIAAIGMLCLFVSFALRHAYIAV